MRPEPLIPLLVLLPLFGGLAIALLPRNRDRQVRAYALGISLVTLLVSLALAVVFFAPGSALANALFARGELAPIAPIPWVEGFGLSFGFGIADAVSMWLILLTTFLMPLTVLGAFSAVPERVREFYLWLLVLEAAMIGVFVATDVIFFYVCFEFTLVPMYFLIGVWGSQDRLRAARVFFLYTFTGSMLTFVAVLFVAWFNSHQPTDLWVGAGQWTFNLEALYHAGRHLPAGQQGLVLAALLAGFAVKVPLFPFHTWLPLAHTEAPTAGSVILAGVLLKLGTYGLLRVALPMVPEAIVSFTPYVAAAAIAGILYTALICWVQKDLKKLIAYSSVSHLGFCVLGMFAFDPAGLGGTGSVLYMVNHGLSTGALFLCVGMIYERFHTREMERMGGLARVMPVWAFFMVFFCLASVGLPGLNGFVGEFLSLLGAWVPPEQGGALGPPYALLAGLGMILGAIYILYLVGKVVFGPVKVPGHGLAGASGGHAGHAVRDLNRREIAVLAPLALACLVIGLYPKPMLSTLQEPVQALNAPVRQVMFPASQGPDMAAAEGASP